MSRAVIRKYVYCAVWSAGLFCVSFFPLLKNIEEAFVFEGKQILDVAMSHLFPMIMALSLYLLDMMYSFRWKAQAEKVMDWIFGTIIVFLVAFVFSIIVNDNIWGWGLFLLSWISLTVLKIKTTDSQNIVLYKVTED